MKHRFRLAIYLVLPILLILSQFVPQVGLFSPHSIYASGNTYYVAKNGSNSNPGTITQPWLTIQKAASTLVAGDTVYVRGGTYNEQVFITHKSGTSSAWITFKPYPGENVAIDGTGLTLTSPKSLVQVYQSDYIDFEGFEIRNAGKSGIGAGLYVTNENEPHQGYIFKDLTIHNCYGTGMLLSQYSSGTATTRMVNVTIDHVIIHDVDTGSDYNDTYSNPAISCTAIKGLEIKNSLIYNIGMQYATWTGQEGIVVRTGSTNVSIHDNEIYQTRSGIYLQSQGIAMDNIAIYDNKLHNNYAWGIVLGSEISPHAMTNVNIYNNLIYFNATINGHSGSSSYIYGNGGFGVMTYNFNKTFSFTNNTLYNNGIKEEIAILEAGPYQQNCVIKNNIISGYSIYNCLLRYTGYPTGVTIDHNLFYNPNGYIEGSLGPIRYGTSYVIANPKFVNPGTDFSLQSGSSAINTGSSLLAPVTDIAGNSRPQGAGIDIGACEYIGSALPPALVGTPQVYASYLSSNNSVSVTGTGWLGQTFTPTASNTLTSLNLNLKKIGAPSGSTIVSIYATNAGVPNGSPLISSSIAASSISGAGYNSTSFNFSGGVILKAGTTYAWMVSLPSGDSSNLIYMLMNTAGSYASGQTYKTSDAGSSWRLIFSGTADFVFSESGISY